MRKDGLVGLLDVCALELGNDFRETTVVVDWAWHALAFLDDA